VAAKDGIVGVYPVLARGIEKEIGTIAGEANSAAPHIDMPHLDIRSVKLSAVDGLFLKASMELRGPVLPDGDPGIAAFVYRVCLNAKKPQADCTQGAGADAVWSIQGGGAGGRGGRGAGAGVRYVASGAGVSSGVKIDGNTISVQGT